MSPEDLAHAINTHLHRFPLILEVLDEIARSDNTYPGDHEIRTGAVEAVASIVAHLKQLRRTHEDHSNPMTAAEVAATEWLRGQLPEKVLPGELHRELAAVLRDLIPPSQK